MRRSLRFGLLFIILLSALLAACSGGSTSTTSKTGGTFTMAYPGVPPSLDPSTGSTGGFEYYFDLAYDSLINLDFDGKYKPELATSWHWVGNDFKTFDMQLRSGVKFSDGSAFDANTVKGWLELQKKNNSVVGAYVHLASADVIGPLEIRLQLTQSNSLLPLYFTRTWGAGIIPCPAAVANPAIIKAATCGGGPYMLDTKHTVTGDTYTYVPNPHYWNPSAVHWSRVVLKVISSSQSSLNALRTGEVQLWGAADSNLVSTAVAAGLKNDAVEQAVFGFDFLYKNGQVVPALKDVRVRQALNYAIDRTALAKALNGGKGRPTSNQFLPGSDAYDPAFDNYYPYDVAKAKQLLAEAGYANGFQLTVLTVPLLGQDTMTQAVASYWQAIGVTVKIDSTLNYFADLTSGKYAISSSGLGGTNPALLAWGCCLAPGSTWNPDTTAVPALSAPIDRLNVTDPAQAAPIARQIDAYMTENAWFVPVFSSKLNFLYDSTKIAVPTVTSVQPVIDITKIRPAQ